MKISSLILALIFSLRIDGFEALLSMLVAMSPMLSRIFDPEKKFGKNYVRGMIYDFSPSGINQFFGLSSGDYL